MTVLDTNTLISHLNPDQHRKQYGMDGALFEKAFHDHHDALTNFMYYKCGDAGLAEDIIQETFMKVWEIREKIRPGTLKPLLYTIAGNLFRNRHHHGKVVLRFARGKKPEVNTESPQFEMEYKEFGRMLEEALSALGEKNREVFLMNRIDSLSYTEIAERLGISVKAVEKRMHRALAELRGKIDRRI